MPAFFTPGEGGWLGREDLPMRIYFISFLHEYIHFPSENKHRDSQQ